MVFEQWPILDGRIFHPERSHGCCLVRATEGPLPRGRYLPAPLTGNKEASMGPLEQSLYLSGYLRVQPSDYGSHCFESYFSLICTDEGQASFPRLQCFYLKYNFLKRFVIISHLLRKVAQC